MARLMLGALIVGLGAGCSTAVPKPPSPPTIIHSGFVSEPLPDSNARPSQGPALDPYPPVPRTSVPAYALVKDDKLRLPEYRLYLRGGFQLFANFLTEARVDGDGGRGTDIELEDDLGFDSDSSTGRVDLDWKTGQRHHVLASYYNISRNATKTIEKDIVVDDVTFEVGASVTTDVDVDILTLSYRYDILQSRRTSIGLSLGAHTLLADLEMSGIATISGGGMGSSQVKRGGDATAPLPVLGTNVDWIMAKNIYFRGAVDFFALEIGDYKGKLIDTILTIEWRPWRHLGVGVGYNRFLVDLEAEGEDWEGEFGYTYNGLLFFLSTNI